MKHVCGLSFDRFSDLPGNIIEIILMGLPLRDAGRTSILSRKWRFQWAKVPHLVFDNTFALKLQRERRDIVKQIYEILLLHQGPILKFTLDMDRLKCCFDIDQIIIFLSRNGIQELTLSLLSRECCPKLPSYIFSCQQLRHLSLKYLALIPPPTFQGFSMLISLQICGMDLAPDVTISSCPILERLKLESCTAIDCLSIDAPNLKFLCFDGEIKYISFINTPLLAVLSFTAYHGSFEGESTFDLKSFFSSAPLIENLHMNCVFLKLLTVGNVSEKFLTVLNYLRSLELSDIYFSEMDELSSAICLIRNSPNLQNLKIELGDDTDSDVEPILEYLEMQDDSDVSLGKLHEVQIRYFSGLMPELNFIKFVLAKSPELEVLRINLASSKIDRSGYQMLMKLARFRRASQKAEIIFYDGDEALV